MSREALAAAMQLAANGYPCFPCRKINKAPTCPSGFHAATTDPGTLRFLWAQYPGALVGVPAGEMFVVIDFDFAKHPESKIYHDGLKLPITRIHRTRSGGLHYLFRPSALVGNTTSRIHRGVDSRGRIWWPVAGYEVLNPDALAPVPDFILEALRRREPEPIVARPFNAVGSAKRRLSGILSVAARAQEGGRNASTFWSACRIADMRIAGEISDEDALAAYAALATVSMHTGLPKHEVDRTINSAKRRVS